MTGAEVLDGGVAAGGVGLEGAAGSWPDPLPGKLGLARSQMPTLVESCEISATLDPQVAARWGLNASVV
ncbi:xylulokinase, partial [Klebsiella pneumoniae]